jgi:hypothetical protein
MVKGHNWELTEDLQGYKCGLWKIWAIFCLGTVPGCSWGKILAKSFFRPFQQDERFFERILTHFSAFFSVALQSIYIYSLLCACAC